MSSREASFTSGEEGLKLKGMGTLKGRAPAFHRRPDLWRRVEELGRAAGEEVSALHEEPDPLPFRCWIYPAKGRGRAIPLFKVLLSNACKGHCLYCANRSGRDCPRWSLSPEELVQAFLRAQRAGLVEGLFLSSSIPEDPSRTMQQLVEAAELLRFKYGFQGYLHLKIMPGASEDLIERTVELADRVSVNLEAPGPERLRGICPEKDFGGMLRQIEAVSRLLEEGFGRARGQTTQFVVGAAGEADREFLELLPRLHQMGLKRCYFEAFRPVPGTPLEGHEPASRLRQRRLYQAEFLLREYGFRPEELVLDEEGNLPQDLDPKLAWAMRHPEFFPVEVNRAEPEELLRVPGFGPRTVSKILHLRSRGKLRREDLKGLPLKRAAPFIMVDGKTYGSPLVQTHLFG